MNILSIIPMGDLSKWERRWVGFIMCCGLVGFAYGNIKMYEDIQ